MFCLFRRQHVMCGMVIVPLIVAMGMLVALQGWKARLVNIDLVPHILSAEAFLRQGHLPDRGCLNTFASYNPPGITWFFLPGVFVFTDPRLFEYLGSGLLYLGTLFGLYLLAYPSVGVPGAVLTVGLYGLSELGLSVAGSLWPRGHPCFYVWMLYWAWRWLHDREVTSFVAALVIWAAGMYVFLELAPAIFLFPVLWLWYRAPLRLWAVAVGVGLSVLLWCPYLTFERPRSFIDLRSQVLRQDILPTHPRQAWCDPTLTLHEGEALPPPVAQAPPLPSLGRRLLVRGQAVLGGFLYNFERVLRPPNATFGSPAGIGLVLLAASSLVWFGLSDAAAAVLSRWWRPWLFPLALGVSLGSLLPHEFLLTRLLQADELLELSTLEHLRLVQVALGLSGVVLWLPVWARRRRQCQPVPQLGQFLVLSLLIPWGMLLVLAEPNPYPLGGERRFWWLWPLQVLMLAAGVTQILPRGGAPRAVTWSAYAVLLLLLLGNATVLSRMTTWWHTGWPGTEAEAVQAVAYVAAHVRAQGKAQVALGYQLLYLDRPALQFFPAEFHVVDPRYKVGADFDLFLRFGYGLTNTTQCAEGIAPDDAYRIVQLSPWWTQAAAFTLQSGWHVLRRFGPYEVWSHVPPDPLP